MSQVQAAVLLIGLVLVAYVLMWFGWRRRGRKHDLPPLVPTPKVADLPEAVLEAGARYYGTTVADDWLDRVVAHGLGARSPARIRLCEDGLDVIRLAGSFRIPVAALKGARHDQGIAGKVVPPHGLLVVTWTHGDLDLDTGFRLSDDSTAQQGTTETHDVWVRTISKLAKQQEDAT